MRRGGCHPIARHALQQVGSAHSMGWDGATARHAHDRAARRGRSTTCEQSHGLTTATGPTMFSLLGWGTARLGRGWLLYHLLLRGFDQCLNRHQSLDQFVQCRAERVSVRLEPAFSTHRDASGPRMPTDSRAEGPAPGCRPETGSRGCPDDVRPRACSCPTSARRRVTRTLDLCAPPIAGLQQVDAHAGFNRPYDAVRAPGWANRSCREEPSRSVEGGSLRAMAGAG